MDAFGKSQIVMGLKDFFGFRLCMDRKIISIGSAFKHTERHLRSKINGIQYLIEHGVDIYSCI